jgi:hypothetical protein
LAKKAARLIVLPADAIHIEVLIDGEMTRPAADQRPFAETISLDFVTTKGRWVLIGFTPVVPSGVSVNDDAVIAPRTTK